MGGIAFLFAGQGAQKPGMGAELIQVSPAAAEVFRKLDAIRPGTSEQCFSGTKEELLQTRNTQPCLYAVELAAAAALHEAGIRPDFLAGFSLGEISALACSGAVSLEEGFRLVCRRGELMDRAAASAPPSAMAAVVKLTAEQVEELAAPCENVWPVNYNCPGQTVVAALKEDLPPFRDAVKTAGGRAMLLAVAGAFHSPLMASASDALADYLSGVALNAPKMPLYSNVTGLPYGGGAEEMRSLLASQVKSPVRWQSIIEHMAAQGVDAFIELGPGTTLSGLVRRTLSGVRIYNVEDRASLEKTIGEVL